MIVVIMVVVLAVLVVVMTMVVVVMILVMMVVVLMVMVVIVLVVVMMLMVELVMIMVVMMMVVVVVITIEVVVVEMMPLMVGDDAIDGDVGYDDGGRGGALNWGKCQAVWVHTPLFLQNNFNGPLNLQIIRWLCVQVRFILTNFAKHAAIDTRESPSVWRHFLEIPMRSAENRTLLDFPRWFAADPREWKWFMNLKKAR